MSQGLFKYILDLILILNKCSSFVCRSIMSLSSTDPRPLYCLIQTTFKVYCITIVICFASNNRNDWILISTEVFFDSILDWPYLILEPLELDEVTASNFLLENTAPHIAYGKKFK